MNRQVGKNDLCPCGSGQKYKYCCIANEQKERIVEVAKCCDSCGNHLQVNLSDDMMNKIASSELPLKIFCKDNDFYLFGLITVGEVMEFQEKLDSGTLTKADFINAYKERINKEVVSALIEDACQLHTAFSSRKKVLDDACDAHFNGKYTLSVPVLFSQIEGILRDIGELALKATFKSTIKKDIWDRRLLFGLTDSAGFFNSFITKLYEGQQDNASFNRNPVLHGMSVNHDSEEWSLILILTLLEIRFFIWFEKNTHDVIR
jgi:hypothetical protein